MEDKNNWRWPNNEESNVVQHANSLIFSGAETPKEHFNHNIHIIVGNKVYLEYSNNYSDMKTAMPSKEATNK